MSRPTPGVQSSRSSDGAPRGVRGAGLRSSVAGVLLHGSWAALLFALARAALFFAMEHYAHGSDLARTELRLAAAAPSIALSAGAVGVAAAALVALRPGGLGRFLRAGASVACVIVAALLIHALLAGLLGDATRRIGWDTPRGRSAHQALAGVSLVSALALAFAERWRRGRAREPRVAFAAVPLAALAIAPLLARAAWQSLEGLMLVSEIEIELPVTRPKLDVLVERTDLAPYFSVITPSLDYEVDGSDMPALVLPAPARVRIRLGDLDEPLYLRARAGIDCSVFTSGAAQALAGTRVCFELSMVESKGRPRRAKAGKAGFAVREVFRGEIAVESLELEQGVLGGTAWLDATGDDGLLVQPGDVIEFSTMLADAQGEVLSDAPLLCGFGGLTLERRTLLPRESSSPEQPNIVLVVMDTQRADRLSVYGYERDTSPRLAELAARGLTYDQAYSTSSWTWPSTASILTGLHPEEHGVASNRACYLPTSLDTLAEVLQRAGYTTAAFSANPLVVPNKNFDQGFESFEHGRGAFRQSNLVLPAVLEWLEAVAGTRFFLYLQLTDPHVPLIPLPEGRRLHAPDVEEDFNPYMIERANVRLRKGAGHTESGVVVTERVVEPKVQTKIKQQYDACTWTGDYYVGLLLDRLSALGLEDETVFVFTSDHGEELFEHGLVEHGKQLYSELVHVPLVLAGPGIPRGARIGEPVSNRHLAPTLARIGGATLAGLPDALDLAAPPADLARLEPSVFFSTEQGWWNGRQGQTIYGLRRGEWVVHVAPEGGPWGGDPGTRAGDVRLYHLASDPGETVDRSADEPKLAAELAQECLDRAAQLTARRVAPGVEAGQGTLQMLRDIGYADE